MQQKLIMMMFERVVCSLGCFVAYFNEIEIVGKIDVGTNALATELFYPALFSHVECTIDAPFSSDRCAFICNLMIYNE